MPDFEVKIDTIPAPVTVPCAPLDIRTTTVISLSDVLWGQIWEVPKRAPLDWRHDPPDADPAYNDSYVREEADYLDGVFKRLFDGSPTFRAVLRTRHVARHAAMVDRSCEPAGRLNNEDGIVEINADYQGDALLDIVALWARAHEYRHVWQLETNAGLPNHADRVPQLLALNRAAEADANAFAAVCVYETLRHEGMGPDLIAAYMEAAGIESVARVFCAVVEAYPSTLRSGLAATAAFRAFFDEENAETLALYDSDLMKVFNAAGGDLRSRFRTSGLQYAKITDYAYAERIARMGKMGGMDAEGRQYSRRQYLKDFEAADFCLTRTLREAAPFLKRLPPSPV